MSARVKVMEVFEFEGQQVRVYGGRDEPLFVAADICKVLKVRNVGAAIALLDEDEKGVVMADTAGGRQKMSAVTECGLYHLIFKSRKEEARGLRRWVVGVLFPMMRRVEVCPRCGGDGVEVPVVKGVDAEMVCDGPVGEVVALMEVGVEYGVTEVAELLPAGHGLLVGSILKRRMAIRRVLDRGCRMGVVRKVEGGATAYGRVV